MNIDDVIKFAQSHNYEKDVIERLKDYRALLFFLATDEKIDPRDKLKDVLTLASNQHPYKIVGKVDTYCSYNEGWSDAVDFIASQMNLEV